MQSNNERATAAFTLSLVGVVISSLTVLVVGVAGLGMFGTFGSRSVMGEMMGGYYSGAGIMNSHSPWSMSAWGNLTWLWVPILAVALGIGVLGVYFMNSIEVSDYA